MKRRARHSSSSGSSDVFYAIADRRRLLDLLARGGESAGNLALKFSLSRPAVSQHLAILRTVALITARREGREQRYVICFNPLTEVHEWLQTYEKFWKTKLAALGDHLRKNHERPEL